MNAVTRPSRRLSRRRLLGAAAAAGLAAALAPHTERVLAAVDLDAAPATAERRWVFVFDLRRCDGCRECTKACQQMHHLPESQEWLKVHELTDSSGGPYFLPVLCQMCQNAPCVRVCPVAATYHTPEGVIVVDQDACIGCRMCMAACPFGARTFNWDEPPDVPEMFTTRTPEFRVPQVRGTVGKCANCIHALREGRFPACVEGCSMKAIYVGDLVEDAATNGRETVVLSRFLRDNSAFRLKEELATDTRVYYIAGHGQDLEY
jgi:dimethyl sulfoxide reductase iron-sulfur subunit